MDNAILLFVLVLSVFTLCGLVWCIILLSANDSKLQVIKNDVGGLSIDVKGLSEKVSSIKMNGSEASVVWKRPRVLEEEKKQRERADEQRSKEEKIELLPEDEGADEWAKY